MRIKDIISLPVETEGGDVVGKVVGIDLNIETHDVGAYHVRTGTFVRQLIGSDADLEILPVQVRSITQKKMIIADLRGKDGAIEKVLDIQGVQNTAQPSMSNLGAQAQD